MYETGVMILRNLFQELNRNSILGVPSTPFCFLNSLFLPIFMLKNRSNCHYCHFRMPINRAFVTVVAVVTVKKTIFVSVVYWISSIPDFSFEKLATFRFNLYLCPLHCHDALVKAAVQTFEGKTLRLQFIRITSLKLGGRKGKRYKRIMSKRPW